MSTRVKFIGIPVAVVLVIAIVVGLCQLFGGFHKTDGGHVGVVRGGGPFSSSKIKDILPANSNRTHVGFFSTVHEYPSNQRFYTIAATGASDSVDVVQVPTADGIQVRLEGTVYFTLNTDENVLKDFDNKYGTRTYSDPTGKNDALNAYDGDDGWNYFLASVLRPVIDNNIREQMFNYRCAELISSCSLVQNASSADQQVVDPSKVVNLATIQDALQKSLQNDLKSTLGGDYFKVDKVNLANVVLPDDLQKAINDTQAAFANVSKAQANVQVAQQDAAANETRQQGYNSCPVCAQIDVTKALPPGITVYAPGNNVPVAVTAPTK